MADTFLTPNVIYTGNDALNKLSLQINENDNILIVTDATMVKLGHVDKIIKIINSIHASYTIFSEINAEPTDTMINNGVKIYKNNNCNKLLAIGGGSPIDSMKAIACLIDEDKEISYFMGKQS